MDSDDGRDPAAGDGTDSTAGDGVGTDGDAAAAVSVTVYSREHCHLCDEAIATLEDAAATVEVSVVIEEVDVDEDPRLREEYGERVPYVLVAGRPAFKFRVDPEEARRRLRAATE